MFFCTCVSIVDDTNNWCNLKQVSSKTWKENCMSLDLLKFCTAGLKVVEHVGRRCETVANFHWHALNLELWYLQEGEPEGCSYYRQQRQSGNFRLPDPGIFEWKQDRKRAQLWGRMIVLFEGWLCWNSSGWSLPWLAHDLQYMERNVIIASKVG